MTRRLTLLALLAGVLVAVPGPHDNARAASGGTNGRIAFVRYTGGAPIEEVYMVSPASGLTANLTNDPATSDTAPDWSPDGKRIAFNRFLPGDGNGVFTIAPNGAALTVHPAWSPDGARIAIARGGDQDDGLPFHIHTVTLATGKTAQVTSGRVVDLLPSWQPL